MPPTAAMPGRAALSMLDSSPSRTSRFTSSPTRRKKIAIRPSLIHSSSGLWSFSSPTATVTGVSRKTT